VDGERRQEASVSVRAVRGATQLEHDERDHMHERVTELVRLILECNRLDHDDLISIWFTATQDLHCDYPAYAARQIGLTDVPLMCTREMDVEGGMPRVVRVMAHVETDLTRADITHVYLHGAAALRRDLAHVRAIPDEPETAGGTDASADESTP
jgi:chorismate mutase